LFTHLSKGVKAVAKEQAVPHALTNIFKKIENGIRTIENALVVFCGVVLMALMFLGTGDVLGRKFLNSPITGTYELSTVMMAAVVLLGWAYTQKEGAHVGVALFFDKFPPKMQTIASLVINCLALALFAVIAFESWKIALDNTLEGRHFQILDLPSGPFYFLVPVGAFFISLEFIISIVHLFNRIRKK
jgi:TRAP-type C4-dicarboxylate transport system permease small subunit